MKIWFGALLIALVLSAACGQSPSTSTFEATPELDRIASLTPTAIVGKLESAIEYVDFPDNTTDQFKFFVDQQFDELNEKAGLSVAVYKNGRLWQYAKGKADSSTNMETNTPTLIRSASKTFLASLILKQIDSGLYSLSDTLGKVLSGNVDYQSFDKNAINPNVTVEELLTMTSGIQDVHDLRSQEYTKVQTDPNWKPSDTIRLVTGKFTSPGIYAYSNTNSHLLGMVAEHVSGQKLNDLYESQLFTPLGVKAILLPQDDAPSNIARPYGDRSNYGGTGFGDLAESASWVENWYESTGRTSWAAAGIVTTPANLAKWAYELFSLDGVALSSDARGSLFNSFDGSMIRIGGWPQQYGYHATKRTMLLTNSDLNVYGHPGGGGGFITVFYYSPKLDASIALLANSHADARGRDDLQGRLSHQTLDEIGQQLFEVISSEGASQEPNKKQNYSPTQQPTGVHDSDIQAPLDNLSLPFTMGHEPNGIMPMGETINHSPPKGHPGIDFQWPSKEAQIIVGLDGTVGDIVTEISKFNGDTIHLLTIITGKYGVIYEVVDFLDFNPSLKIGDKVSHGTILGYPQKVESGDGRMIHWSFGKANPTGGMPNPEGVIQNYYMIWDCPLPYLKESELLRLEHIWKDADYDHKDKYPNLCNGFYELQD
jgi:D-alanyl-D-alanine carboxypeptidase